MRSFLTKYAVKNIPVGAVKISRETYEEKELGRLSTIVSDNDAFEAEKQNFNFIRRTRCYYIELNCIYSYFVDIFYRLAVKKHIQSDRPAGIIGAAVLQLSDPDIPETNPTIAITDVGVQQTALPVLRRTRYKSSL